jgi:hypothetical protein
VLVHLGVIVGMIVIVRVTVEVIVGMRMGVAVHPRHMAVRALTVRCVAMRPRRCGCRRYRHHGGAVAGGNGGHWWAACATPQRDEYHQSAEPK